jgi:hypothetical protein
LTVLADCATNDSDGIGGTLTVTDIPSEYNGKYALFNADLGNDTYIRGYQSVNESTSITTLSQISNGSVNIPLWLWINREAANSFYLESYYTGNNTVTKSQANIEPCILIFAGDKQGPLIDPLLLARIEFPVVIFSNGSAAISANTGTLKAAQY